MSKAKEVATKIAIEIITQVANEELTGEEKEKKVCEFIAKLDNSIVGVGLIPDELEAELIDAGIDKVQAFFADINVKAFVKKNYERIKNLLKKLFHKK